MIKFIGSIPGFDQGFKNMTIHAFLVEFIAFISKFWYSFLFKFGHIFSEDLLQVNDLQLDCLWLELSLCLVLLDSGPFLPVSQLD